MGRQHWTDIAQSMGREGDLRARAVRQSEPIIAVPVGGGGGGTTYSGPWAVTGAGTTTISAGGDATKDVIQVPLPTYPWNVAAPASAVTVSAAWTDLPVFLHVYVDYKSSGSDAELRTVLYQQAYNDPDALWNIHSRPTEYYVPLAYIDVGGGGVISAITQVQYGPILLPWRPSRLWYTYDNRTVKYRYNARKGSAGDSTEVTVTLSSGSGTHDIYFGFVGGSAALQTSTSSPSTLDPWWKVGYLSKGADNKITTFEDYSMLWNETQNP